MPPSVFATTRTYKLKLPTLCLCCTLYHGGRTPYGSHTVSASVPNFLSCLRWLDSVNWCEWWDSNPQKFGFEPNTFASYITLAYYPLLASCAIKGYLAEGRGFEPLWLLHPSAFETATISLSVNLPYWCIWQVPPLLPLQCQCSVLLMNYRCEEIGKRFCFITGKVYLICWTFPQSGGR